MPVPDRLRSYNLEYDSSSLSNTGNYEPPDRCVSISFANTGSTAATINGVSLAGGKQYTVNAPDDGILQGSISYTATGTTVVVQYLVFEQ